MTTLTIGLTGGIGSGKSTVAKFFAELNIEVIDTDVIARDVVAPNSAALKKITVHFGKQILNVDGSLNRAKLKNLVFANEQDRLWLEALLHPLIRKIMQQQINAAKSPYVIVAIPLLVETGSIKNLDRILVTDTTKALQIKRTQQRDQLSRKQIEAILKTQATPKQRLAIADDVIDNDGDLAKLKQQVLNLDKKYRMLATTK